MGIKERVKTLGSGTLSMELACTLDKKINAEAQRRRDAEELYAFSATYATSRLRQVM